MSGILRRIKDFIFGSISEMELTAFFLVILFPIIEYREGIFDFFEEVLSDAIAISNTAFIIYTFLCSMIPIYLIFLFATIAYNALKHRDMSLKEKRLLSVLFYLLFPFIIIFSLFEIPASSALNIIELIGIVFLAVRMIALLILLFIFSKMNKEHLYVERLSNKQITKFELMLIVALSITAYISLGKDHGVFSTISLTYFYTILIISSFRSLLGVSRPVVDRFQNSAIKGPIA